MWVRDLCVCVFKFPLININIVFEGSQDDGANPELVQLLQYGAACNVYYLFSQDTDQLTGPQVCLFKHVVFPWKLWHNDFNENLIFRNLGWPAQVIYIIFQCINLWSKYKR